MKTLGLLLILPAFLCGAAAIVYTLFHVIVYARGIERLGVLVLIMLIIGVTVLANAETFEYKNKLVIQAPDYKIAAKLCFKKLNPVFVSEEKALNVIDVCSNPVKGEIK